MVSLILTILMHSIELIGVAIMCFGVIHALYRYGLGLLKKSVSFTVDDVRLDLGRNIVLAVEFLLAGDLIKTIILPNYYEIGMLGALVVIRTVLTYFLNQELNEIRK